jgi:Leucine-rich repeat (LRR) protein
VWFQGCACFGLSFVCSEPFAAQEYPQLRSLHASHATASPAHLTGLSLLVYLGLPSCGLRDLDQPVLPNLRVLDLSDNDLKVIRVEQFLRVRNLETLTLAGNPLTLPLTASRLTLTSLRVLDLSRVTFETMNFSTLAFAPYLQMLNMSGSGVKVMNEDGFQSLPQLNVLDLSGCPLPAFPRAVLQPLNDLDLVVADNFKLYCAATLPPDFNPARCLAPRDDISSCQDLLRSDFYRVMLVVMAILALLGNLLSLLYRALSRCLNTGYAVLVVHLCVSDFLMGVYLAIVGVADRVFAGEYLWRDGAWRRSGACLAAGVLCTLSSEVSALVICLLTLERFLVIRFPFR